MSNVLPARYYSRDPADIVENDQLHKLGCRACEHVVSSLTRWYCSNEKAVKFHKRVPHIGPSCKCYQWKG